MSLPACQQRVLDRMEGALRASEPQLTSMYAVFSRLNAGEPIGTEQLPRKRLRWFQPGTAMYAIVLIPVMFAAIIVGALLGGGARSTTACEASYSVGGVSPLAAGPHARCRTSRRPGCGRRYPPRCAWPAARRPPGSSPRPAMIRGLGRLRG